jgi:carboxyl-terminal processing protease
VENVPENDVISKVRGQKGTKVTLEIVRPPQRTPLTFTLTRDEIRRTTVDTEALADGIFHITISRFQPSTDEEFRDQLKDVMAQRPAGIVLDLRNNPGGFLDVVVDVASQFLKDGLVLYDVDGDGKRTDWPVNDGGLAQRIPMVVLVNHGSASGSEVVSGALQGRNRAKVIGTQTFGKGSVNQAYPLSDGSSVRLTTAKWYAPNGLQISKVGITPDIIVDKTPEDDVAGRDPQMAKAIEVLKSEIQKSAEAGQGGAPSAG